MIRTLVYDHLPHNPDPVHLIGETTFRKQYQRFGLLAEDRLRHVWIIGKTGAGKSTLLSHQIAQDLAAGHGLAVLDPHGDLVDAALAHVPRSRINDVLLFAPEDVTHPVSFNVFRRGRAPYADRALLASHLVSLFHAQWSDSWGPRLEHVLRNATLAVAEHADATLLLLYHMLTDDAVRAHIAAQVADPVVRQFWTHEFPSYRPALQAEALSPVLNKLGAYVANPVIRHIVGQVRSRVDLRTLMDDSGILLARLPVGVIGLDAARLLGGMLVTSLHLAALTRPVGSTPFYVYLDEFQHFVTDALAGLLAESRKFGVGLTLAHQYLTQLPPHLSDAVLGNVGTLIAFRLGASDAQALEGEFSPPFTAADLQALPRHEIAVKLLARGESLTPFSARTLTPADPPADAGARIARIVAQSRDRYCRPRAQVAAQLARAFTARQRTP